jgi:hypothetical protein
MYTNLSCYLINNLKRKGKRARASNIKSEKKTHNKYLLCLIILRIVRHTMRLLISSAALLGNIFHYDKYLVKYSQDMFSDCYYIQNYYVSTKSSKTTRYQIL